MTDVLALIIVGTGVVAIGACVVDHFWGDAIRVFTRRLVNRTLPEK